MAMNAGIARIAFYFAAITGCFCVYSLIQERLMTVGFGPEKEIFEYSVFIVLINRLVTCAVAAASLKFLGQSLSPSAPLLLFAIPSVANVIGSSAQYEALKYVNFPLQALSKCAKSVPVMAWSWVTQTRKYYPKDYISAATVTLGCMAFVLTGDIRAPTAASSSVAPGLVVSFTGLGLGLLAVFMIFDGLTCTSQDKLFSSYDMHSCNQLLFTAAWSAVLSAAFLAGSGQIWGAMSFVLRHPDSMWLMLLQSAVSTTVQLFIVFTIKQYGALNFALMMTLRQFLSIVLSCLVFRHTLSTTQWLGTLLVIGGLLARSLDKATGSNRNAGIGGETPPPKVKLKVEPPPTTPQRPLSSSKSLDPERQALLRSPPYDVSANGIGMLPNGIMGGLPSPKPPLNSVVVAREMNGSSLPGYPMASVLQPLGNVLTSPLRGSLRGSLSPSPSGDWKEKVKPG